VEFRSADLTADLPQLVIWNEQLIEDENAPYRIGRPALASRMEGWLAADYRAVVFVVKGRDVGYALFRPEDDGFYLRQFVIDRDARRRGYGKQAIAVLMKQGFGPGSRVKLEVLNENSVGLAFWRALGFENVAQTLVARVPE
jgi:ribosomal protein S18 acetylase RimI-like enzyme